ncbi:hypothetical protein Rhom172_0965 [Rhodothermus marinus SG0.5JP17-172]|uniref:hypothetical protein n=1 Tax=Rhodothermus marinus TaxID=29549 RepID=UPI000223D8AD|nr:hypothetical protein [Rhodothermus marinus]AEN72895.1 hypothetical protein Rhom172_0965 [Rhodothermus marinus SG0.5JP17-172]MBO2491632.1 hypothetical protein [Rhodothermus marinus]
MPAPSPLRRIRLEQARVRIECREALATLIERLFLRRSFLHLTPADQQWQRPELVQLLRRHSRLYQTISTPFDGPLPFALGYFRVSEDELEPIAEAIPMEDPEQLAWLLSEFLEPGARLWVEMDEGWQGWQIVGEGQLRSLSEVPER